VAGHIHIIFAADLGNGTALIQEACVDRVDAAGLAIAERTQQNAIHDGEDGCVEANSNGKSKHHGRGK